MEKITHITIKSPSAEGNQHRREHVFLTISDRGLAEGFKRALQKTSCKETRS